MSTTPMTAAGKTIPKILELSSATRRGREATLQQTESFEVLISELEAVPQAVPPLQAPSVELLGGLWHLLYLKSGKVNPTSVQSTSIRESNEESPATQLIDIKNLRAENAASFKKFGLPLKVKINASIVPLEDMKTVRVEFRNFFLFIANIPVFWFPVWIFGPKGTLTTTFLSEDCRVGRGDKGSIFFLVKNL